MSQVNFNVAGDHGNDKPYFITDNPPGGIRVDAGYFENPGRFVLPCPPNVTGGGELFYQNGQRSFRIIIPPEVPAGAQWEAGLPPCIPPEYAGNVEAVALIYRPLFAPLPRLVRRGAFFQQETGARITGVDRTEFKALHRVLHEGVDAVESVLQQRQDLGYNWARVLATCHGMFRLYPQEHGQAYWVAAVATARALAAHGSYMNLVVFADATMVMPTKADQIRFWGQWGELAQQETNILLSAVNEADQTINQLAALYDLAKIPGVLCSRGSNGGSYAVPPRPWMDWEELHTNGQTEWWRKDHNAMELSEGTGGIPASRVPVGVSERPRAIDQDGTEAHFEDAGKVAALLCAFGTFHSQRGKTSELWDGQELRCGTVFAHGMQSVPLKYQDGRYNRPDDPNYLRVYQRILDGGDAHTVQVRK